MIARVGAFSSLSPEAQEGFVGGYWLAGKDGRLLSITLWESEEGMQRGGQHANATPLLPGQDPANIPSPDTIEVVEVVAIA